MFCGGGVIPYVCMRQTDMNKDREVRCVRLKLGNMSQDSWVAFLSPRLKDPGKGSCAEPTIMWGKCTPESKAPSSSPLITSPRKIQNHPLGPRRSSPGLGSFQLEVLREHPGWRPCLPQAFPHPSPLWNVPLLSCTLLLTRTLEF